MKNRAKSVNSKLVFRVRATYGVKMYCIYLAKNKVNGKLYIGKTLHFERRKKEHLSSNSEDLFHRAIRKYGIDNFEWEIIEDGIQSNYEACERESYWIRYFNSYFKWVNSNGYNMTKGGDGGNGWNSRKVAAYSLSGDLLKSFDSITECVNFYGISGTTSVSCVCDDNSKTCNEMMFRYYEDVPIPKIDPYSRKSPKSRAICQLDTDGNLIKEYEKISDVVDDGYNRTGVVSCLTGKYKTSCGFLWCYKECLPQKIGTKPTPIEGVCVSQYDVNWVFIKTFPSCAEAARSIGAKNHKLIHKALKTKSHIAHGYRWIKNSEHQQDNTEVTV